jgi:hypothetical protein
MNRLLRAGFAAGFLLAFQASPAKASTIYINGNGVAEAESGVCSEDSGACVETWTVFDDFVVSAETTLTDIFWTSALWGGLSDLDGIRAWIYDADPVFGGGNLQHTIATQDGNPVGNVALNALYGFDFFFDVQLTGLNIILTPGTYWLGMQHDTISDVANVACILGGCGNGGNSTQWDGNANPGDPVLNRKEYAFRLEGNIAAVPDSGSLAPLVGLVWAAMFVWRRQA